MSLLLTHPDRPGAVGDRPPGQRTGRGRTRRAVAIVVGGWLVTVVAALVSATPAAAHAQLLETAPAAGSRSPAAPSQVLLRFDEAVQLDAASVQVFDEQGSQVSVGGTDHADGDPAQARVRLRPGLGDGGYLVSWRVVSADTHPVHGAFTFTVGDGPALAVAADPSRDDPSVAAATSLARWVQYLGLVLLIGCAAFLVLCWRRGFGDVPTRRLVGIGALAVAVGALLAFAAEGPLEDGLGLTGAFGPGLLARTAGEPYGQILLARVVLAAVTALAVQRATRAGSPGRLSWWWLAAAAAGLGLVATFAQAGHAAVGELSVLTRASVVVHTVAACLWLGGLVVILTRLVPPRNRGDLLPAAARFSLVAITSVVLITVTGTWQAWRELGSWAALVSTRYGLLICVKVALLVLLVGLAYVSRGLVDRGRTGRATADTVAAGRGWSLHRSVTAEASAAVVVLALSAVLSGSVPGKDAYVATVDTALTLPGAGTVQVTMTPVRAGSNQVGLQVRDDAGRLHDYPEVEASLTLPDRDIGPLPIPLQHAGPGTYQAAAADIPLGGDWRLTVTVRTTDVDITTASTDVDVT